MGRWKDNGSGQAYFDPQDSGPDQIAAPTSPAGSPASRSGFPIDPRTGLPANTGITGGMDRSGGVIQTDAPTGGVTGQPNVGAGDLGVGDPAGPWRQLTPSPIPSMPQGAEIPDKGFYAQPIDGGWNGGSGQPKSIDEMLAMLRDRWGKGSMGAAAAAAQHPTSPAVAQRPGVPQTPSAAPRQGIGRTILGALGWRG